MSNYKSRYSGPQIDNILDSVNKSLVIPNSTVNSNLVGYRYLGVATPDTEPDSTKSKIFYVASQEGTYVNFNDIVVTSEELVILRKADSGVWVKDSIANLNQSFSTCYTTCETSSSTSEKSIVIPSFSLSTSIRILVKVSYPNTSDSTVTLSVNSENTKSLYFNGSPVSSINTWSENQILDIFYDGEVYQAYPITGTSSGGGVTSVNGKTGEVTLDKSDVGLGNVDNTADSNKSVAYATKIGSSSSHPQVGSATQPVYVNSEGTITAGTTLEGAAYKDVVTTLDSSSKLPTSGAVKTYVDNVIKVVDGDVVLIGRVSPASGQVTFISSVPQAPMPYKDFLNLDPDTYEWMRPGLMLVVTNSGTLIEDEWEEGGETHTKTAEVEEGDQILIFEYGSDSHPMWTPIYIQRNVDKATADTLGLVKVPHHNGLSVDNSGSVQLALATQSAAGAMSAADKTALDNFSTDISGKADKVSGATSGNFAGLDANGNLIDSGHKPSDYKTVQTPKSDPSAGISESIYFIATITQNANGEITATKQRIRQANPAHDGLMTSADVVKLEKITQNMLDAQYWQGEPQ